MPYDQPFAADDGLPDFDPRLATHNPMRKHMEQAAQENPFALGQAAYQPPKALLEKPNWMPTPWSQPISETLNPAEQVAGIGTGLTNAAAAAYHGNLMDSAKELAPLALGMTMPMAPKGRVLAPRIEGRYSVAEEAALNAQRKQGNAQAWTSELTKGGAKPAELEAMQWQQFLKDNPNPSRDDVIKHLQENRPQLKTTNYGETPVIGQKDFEAYRQAHGLTEQDRLTFDQVGEWRGDPEMAGPIKWKSHNGVPLLLDPDNPNGSNRETVLSEGPSRRAREIEERMKANQREIHDSAQNADLKAREESYGLSRLLGSQDALKDLSPAEKSRAALAADQKLRDDPELARLQSLRSEQSILREELGKINEGRYQEPHFKQVPNYLSHLRTGIYNDEQGRPTYHIDELQSTRAQKVAEEGGPRDDAKIAELQARVKEASEAEAAIVAEGRDPVTNRLKREDDWHKAVQTRDLRVAELEAATSAPPGHPWVNDERTAYLNTAREAIRQATDSGVAGISLTPGSLQNERYKLSNHVDWLRFEPRQEHAQSDYGDGLGYLTGGAKGKKAFEKGIHTREELEAHVGKEMAEHLLSQPLTAGRNAAGSPVQMHELKDLKQLEIGGKGMRDWYDTRYPAIFKQELERLHREGGGEKGSYPGQGQVNLDYDAGRRMVPGTTNKFEDTPKTPMHYFPLTDQIREAVKKGLPFFSLLALLRQQKQEQQPQLEQAAPFAYEQ